jgi:hypothetical protein
MRVVVACVVCNGHQLPRLTEFGRRADSYGAHCARCLERLIDFWIGEGFVRRDIVIVDPHSLGFELLANPC